MYCLYHEPMQLGLVYFRNTLEKGPLRLVQGQLAVIWYGRDVNSVPLASSAAPLLQDDSNTLTICPLTLAERMLVPLSWSFPATTISEPLKWCWKLFCVTSSTELLGYSKATFNNSGLATSW